MNRKILIIISMILLLSVVLSGCSNSLKEENAALNKELAVLKVKNTALENTVADLNKKLEDQQYIIDTSMQPAFRNNSNIYPLYTADINTYKIEEDAYIYIPEDASVRQKLDILAKALSEVYFNSSPIEVVRIEVIDKKKIAVINLKETPENQGKIDPKDTNGKTWIFQYMQGSTGGTITQTTLVETMLQRQYKGQWVDGVKFLYDGGVCAFEHAYGLKDINFRD